MNDIEKIKLLKEKISIYESYIDAIEFIEIDDNRLDELDELLKETQKISNRDKAK